ncbi:hypothetical protein GCM10027259_48050 [Micromonospora palomenae]
MRVVLGNPHCQPFTNFITKGGTVCMGPFAGLGPLSRDLDRLHNALDLSRPDRRTSTRTASCPTGLDPITYVELDTDSQTPGQRTAGRTWTARTGWTAPVSGARTTGPDRCSDLPFRHRMS